MDQQTSARKRLEKAGIAASERLSNLSNETSELEISFHFPEVPKFSARVWKSEATYNVSVSQGVVEKVDELWEDVRFLAQHQRKELNHSILFDSEIDLKRSANLTLEWFILHEIMHLQLGHVDLMDSLELFEIEDDEPQAEENTLLASSVREKVKAIPYSRLRRCLEITADSDATRFHLGQFDLREADELRRRASAAFVAMASIDRHSGKVRRTHPGTNTRFFLVFAHLFQMWLQPSTVMSQEEGEIWLRGSDEPDPDEFESFITHVIKPCVDAAVDIAHLAGAQNFIDDMRGEGALFHDIETIQYADPLKPDLLRTEAAREWLELQGIAVEMREALAKGN